MQRLRIIDPESGEVVATLRRTESGVSVEAVNDALRSELTSEVVVGFVEWVEEEGVDGPRQRVTEMSDPEFLPRLGEDLRRQFNFRIELDDVQD